MMTSVLWWSIGLVTALALVAIVAGGLVVNRRLEPERRDSATVASSTAVSRRRAADLLAAGLLPLADCPRGRPACLRCLQVDRCVVHRLLELGLTPGVELSVVQDNGGPMLISVRGSRVALGRDLAENLWVEVAASSAGEPGRGGVGEPVH
jgi:Fe2+ transport system protein FeoA